MEKILKKKQKILKSKKWNNKKNFLALNKMKM